MSELRFVHVRPVGDWTKGQKYARKGGMTLAYRPPERHGDKMIWVATAVCSKHDAYCKKRGRELAEKKFHQGECIQIATTKKMGLGHQLQFGFANIMKLGLSDKE